MRTGSSLIHLSFWNKWYLKYYIFIGRFIQEKELFDPLLWQKFCRILHVTCIFNKKWIKKNNWSLCPKWSKTYINHPKKSDQKNAFFIFYSNRPEFWTTFPIREKFVPEQIGQFRFILSATIVVFIFTTLNSFLNLK